MLFDQVRELAAAFAAAKVRYLLVGGLAVIAHGYARLTQDVDIVLDLDDATNVSAALAVLERLGYRPRAPVPLAAFADAALRARWGAEKDMLVFSCWRDGGDGTELDLFLAAPFPFTDAWAQRLEVEIETGVSACIVDLQRLLAMKAVAARAKDLEDIRILRGIADA